MAYDQALKRETFTHAGRLFEVALFADDDNAPPWERADGHGPVRYISDSEPLAPGETVLYDCPRGRYVYDLRAAIKQSMREGWGRPCKEMRETLARQLRKPASKVSAIDADMAFLRGWCADDWSYIGASVRIIGADGEPVGEDFEHALWGFESSGDYWQEVAAELAENILHERRAAWLAALREARERKAWAARGVETV